MATYTDDTWTIRRPIAHTRRPHVCLECGQEIARGRAAVAVCGRSFDRGWWHGWQPPGCPFEDVFAAWLAGQEEGGTR